MKFTYTDGTIHSEPDMCACGRMNTAGYCPQCNPLRKSRLDRKLEELAKDAPPIEEIWEITKRLPSFTDLISERRE